jgi:hypothetical protein
MKSQIICYPLEDLIEVQVNGVHVANILHPRAKVPSLDLIQPLSFTDVTQIMTSWLTQRGDEK